MKKVFHKILAMLMSFVVLFSTMSFTIDMHYCGDTLVDTAILNKAKSCGMDIDNTDSHHSNMKGKCCSEKQIVVKGQNEITISFDNLSFNQQLFITSYVYTFINLFEGLESQIIPFKDYAPPLVVKDIQKLDETYLI